MRACCWLAFLLVPQGLVLGAEGTKPFKLQVVDEQTGRGVPLVELRTVHGLSYYTDSAGAVAFAEPGLMHQQVFFYVHSHGYEFPKDGFGYRGKAVRVTPGGSAVLKIKRLNLAQRLYRVTGAGIYADSVLLGDKTPLKQPVLNGLVLGSDSVLTAFYRGKVHWFWGDTNRPGYPLGNFHVPMATSLLPAHGGLDPDVGVDLEYLVDDKGFAKATAKLPGPGPCWLGGLIVLKDKDRERLFATYLRVKGYLEIYERGLVEFNDATQQFDKLLTFDKNLPPTPLGHPFLHRDDGTEYIYYAHPYPTVRVRAAPAALLQPNNYQAWTCLAPGSRLEEGRVVRDAQGRLQFSWQVDTPPIGPAEQVKLLRTGAIKEGEVPWPLKDIVTGKPVQAHGGSINWNAHRNKWIMIAVESGGTSALGEVWYAEADQPMGPWTLARKVVTHNRYSFYNPKQHPLFDKGRWIYFEGTYTEEFSGGKVKTPRYDYNQIMYKLDLDDPRLHARAP